jgi:hypothetical protein
MIPLQKDRVTIFVELLDEGVKCWRPVSADRVSEDTYRIVGSVPQGEVWLFQPGEIVRLHTATVQRWNGPDRLRIRCQHMTRAEG